MRTVLVVCGFSAVIFAASSALAAESPDKGTAASVAAAGSSMAPDPAPGDDALAPQLAPPLRPYFSVEGESRYSLGDEVLGGVMARRRQGWAGHIVGYLPIRPGLDLIARIGEASGRFKDSILPGGRLAPGGADWSVGAQYKISKKNGVRVEYMREQYTEHSATGDGVVLSLVRSF